MTGHDADPAGRARAGRAQAGRDSPGRDPGRLADDARSPDERRADHAAIDRLADELLPALIAKLGASGLGELDVREGAWHVRLRMPVDGRGVRRSPGRSAGRTDGHATAGWADGHAPAGHAPAGHATHPPVPATGGPLREPADSSPDATHRPDAAPTRAIATAPAVGFYRPIATLAAGARVRAGDRLGTIDVLGVPHELVAPDDGIVGATLVEPGDPVEYGQDVVEIELPEPSSAARGEGA